ncbi:MAG: tRNA (N6-threonylcarbamoyladenosine(37)-N6)-methyltransferase TrmO [Ruminococcaceae bacterium]|nr:tRNA (N6-threonylcarbamoyladenosine(37)-N6)-methyltransferase TrmO [Oscillospiraceae bacterium]
MKDTFTVEKIAEIRNGFSEKFGIPRQSGLCGSVKAKIVFEPEYRVKEAFRDLEGFSHIWLIWQFSEAVRDEWSPTVRPPRLGGNKRTGVFATRSPFRPNPLGLSCVKLDKIEMDEKLGPVLHVSGADLLDKTPIYDIKPYIPYADCKPDASDGFTGSVKRILLEVIIPDEIKKKNDDAFLQNITEIIAQDPRPAYQNDPERIYKLDFEGLTVSFKVNDNTATLLNIERNS